MNKKRHLKTDHRRTALALGLLLALPLLLAAIPCSADTWYEHYARAERAIDSERWPEAIEELGKAIKGKERSRLRARTYGKRVIIYLPYLKLGIAHYHNGELDAALRAFDREEQLAVIKGSRQLEAQLEHYRQLALDAKREAPGTQ